MTREEVNRRWVQNGEGMTTKFDSIIKHIACAISHLNSTGADSIDEAQQMMETKTVLLAEQRKIVALRDKIIDKM